MKYEFTKNLDMKKLLFPFFMMLPVLVNAFTGKVEIDGIYYNVVTKAHTAEVTRGNQPYSGNIVLPSTIEYDGIICEVSTIDDKAFYYCDKLNSITIPETIKTIGGEAFKECTGLTAVHISDIITWCGISFETVSYSNAVYSNPLRYSAAIVSLRS